MILLAAALGFPELFTLLIVTQVKHLLNVFLIFYLLFRDVELVPFQHHIAVFPNLPENPFPAEFPDPADLLWFPS